MFNRDLLPNPQAYYSQYFAFKGNKTKPLVLCCFHHDKTASLSLDLSTGRFNCFGCGASGGNVLDFHQLKTGLSFVESCKDLGAWVDTSTDTPEQLAARKAKVEQANKEYKAKQAQAAKAEKEHAQAFIPLVATILKQCTKPMPDTPYCVAKGINSHNLTTIAASDIQKFILPKDDDPKSKPVTVCYGFNGLLTVAILETLDGEQVALQAFDGVPDVKGKYARWIIGKPVLMGAYYRIGDFTAPSVVLITEGIADAISCFEATGYPCLAAISKGQLGNAAQAVKAKYSQALIVLCGDNDTDGGGERAAIAAAQVVNGLVVIPKGLDGVKDFNDLHQQHSVESVKKMIDAAIDSKKAVPDAASTALNSEIIPHSIEHDLTSESVNDIANEWLEPDPIIAPQESTDYPIEHLPDPLRLVVLEIVNYLQCPIAMAANSVLAALSLSTQGLVDVARDNHLIGPVSLFLMVIAESGERKSACDNLVLNPIKRLNEECFRHDQDERKLYFEELNIWNGKNHGLTQALTQASKNGEPTDKWEQDIKIHAQTKPKEPKGTTFLYEDATTEGLTKGLYLNSPSGGIFSSEAGVVFGGHGMSKDNVKHNMATLNKFWDGEGVITNRADSTKNMLLTGRRLTLCLATQESTVRAFFDGTNGLARGTGFGARFLIAWPKSTQGTRFYKTPPFLWAYVGDFSQKAINLLNQLNKDLSENNATGELRPKTLHLSKQAEAAWIEFYNDTERELCIGGELTEIKDVTSKAADNVARIAALFHVYEHGVSGEISEAHILNAGHIMAWHLMESKRFFSEVSLSKELRHVVMLDDWLVRHCKEHQTNEISTRTLKQLCPNALRSKSKLDDAISHLTDLNRVKIVNEGKKKTIHINPKLLEV